MYCMIEVRDGKMPHLQFMSEECYQIVKEALEKTKMMRDITESFAFFRNSLKNLEIWCRSAERDAQSLIQNKQTAEQLCREMLSQFKTYLDHTETMLKRKYGEYGVTYRLRHYSQHCESVVHSFAAPEKKNFCSLAAVPKRF
ncbi:MAG: hypothetical protein ACI4DV_01800 [Lachnospiraceae bacterium]